jgi:hypothetical protein
VLDAEGVKQRNDGEVARLHNGARLDLPHRRDSYLGAHGELFLGQACLYSQATQPRSQPSRLRGVATVYAWFPSRAGHFAILR